MNRIELYADVSYAPGGGRSHQGVMAYYGGALVQWLSVRQAFTTLSTAEAELVGYLEAMTMGQSVAVVLGVLEGGAWDDLIIDVTRRLEMDGQEKLYGGIRAQAGASRGGDPGELEGHERDLPAADREGAGDFPREDRGEQAPLEDRDQGRGGSFVVYGDNSSAITIIESADGPWRTRHLRLRAEVLREKVKCGRWAVRHLPGTRLVADYLTKAMTAKAQWPKFYELAGMVMAEPDGVGPPAESTAQQNLSKLKLAGLALVMGKVVNWSPDQAEDVMVKNLCLAALGVGVAYVATQINRGHGVSKIKKGETRSPREDEPGAGKGPRVPEPGPPRESSRDHEPELSRKMSRENEPGRRIAKMGWGFGGKAGSCALNEQGPPHLKVDHCPEGCPARKEGSTDGQPWFFERGVERPPEDDPRFSIEEEPEDFWDVEVNEREMVMTRIHMLPRHGDYQPRADALPPGASLERLEQRRQTNIVYEDMDLGRRFITDRWSEEAFRFRNAWRGATTFWMPLEREVMEGDAAVPQVRDADRGVGSRTRSLAPNGEAELSRPVRPRLQALRFQEVKVMKAEDLTLGPAGAGGDDPGGDWQPSIDEDPEDHWEVEFLPGNLVERIRSYEPDRRDLPIGVFLEDFLDRRESFINPVNHREETPRGIWGEVVDDNWRRDRWLREGWTGSSRFWVRPRRREIIFEVRPLTDQERQDEMDHDDTGDPGASGSGGASSSGAAASMTGSTTRPADTLATGDQKRPRTSRCAGKKESYVPYAVDKDLLRRIFILVVIFSMTVGTCAQNQEEQEEDQMLWWIIFVTALLAVGIWEILRRGFRSEKRNESQDPFQDQGSNQETSPEGFKGSPQEKEPGFPGSSKQEKRQEPQEEARGPTERDRVEGGSTGGPGLKPDPWPAERRLTTSPLRLPGREIACRTVGEDGRLRDVMVPKGALSDPARMAYFKNTAVQSWKRYWYTLKREEAERRGFRGPGEFRLSPWEDIPIMPCEMWPHGQREGQGEGDDRPVGGGAKPFGRASFGHGDGGSEEPSGGEGRPGSSGGDGRPGSSGGDDRLGSGKEEDRIAGGGSGSSATASRRARAAGAVVLRAAFPDCPRGSKTCEGPRGPTPCAFCKMG